MVITSFENIACDSIFNKIYEAHKKTGAESSKVKALVNSLQLPIRTVLLRLNPVNTRLWLCKLLVIPGKVKKNNNDRVKLIKIKFSLSPLRPRISSKSFVAKKKKLNLRKSRTNEIAKRLPRQRDPTK